MPTDQTPTTEPGIGIYRERAHLVALLAALYPSHIGYTDPAEPDWAVVTIESPAGQWCWHIAPDDMDLFEHIRASLPTDPAWDGHTTDEKYQRIRTHTRAVPSLRHPDAEDETIEYGIHWRFPQVDHIEQLRGPDDSRRALADELGPRHTLVHRRVIRRPDTVGDWIEGEPTTAGPDDAGDGVR